MSDHKHFDTILPFLQLHDVPHRIDLTIADIEAMHTAAGRDVEFLHPTSLVHTRSRGPLDSVSASPFVSDPSLADSGENSRNAGDLPAESANTNDDIRVSDSTLDMELTLKDHKRFKHAKDVPPDAVIQFLKPSMLGQIQAHRTRSHFPEFFSEGAKGHVCRSQNGGSKDLLYQTILVYRL